MNRRAILRIVGIVALLVGTGTAQGSPAFAVDPSPSPTDPTTIASSIPPSDPPTDTSTPTPTDPRRRRLRRIRRRRLRRIRRRLLQRPVQHPPRQRPHRRPQPRRARSRHRPQPLAAQRCRRRSGPGVPQSSWGDLTPIKRRLALPHNGLIHIRHSVRYCREETTRTGSRGPSPSRSTRCLRCPACTSPSTVTCW